MFRRVMSTGEWSRSLTRSCSDFVQAPSGYVRLQRRGISARGVVQSAEEVFNGVR